jgi:hypothetical protein
LDNWEIWRFSGLIFFKLVLCFENLKSIKLENLVVWQFENMET